MQPSGIGRTIAVDLTEHTQESMPTLIFPIQIFAYTTTDLC
jgi:hypothetical protein